VNASHLYRAALLCGAAPLAVGIGILLLWILTRADFLEEAGFWCIAGGTVSVVLGLLLLIVWSQKRDPKSSTWKANLGAIVLLLINFPAAAGTITVVLALKYPLHEMAVADVSKEQTLRLATDLKYPNSIEIRAIGELDAPATFSTETYLEPVLSLKAGPNDVCWGGDWYSQSCVLHYVPQKGTRGRLRVEYRFR